MKIHELAEQSGLTADTIRYYEKEGLLDPGSVSRDPNNYRNYTAEALERLALIKKLQTVGFSLAELRETLNEPDGDLATNERIIEQIRSKIEDFKRRMAEYDHILQALTWMLEYREMLHKDPKRAEAMMRKRRADIAAWTAAAMGRTPNKAKTGS
ncbi:MAG TPA: MerR family transcriptional regulator [Spirochaetia bacterium]|nr:MerR family transcriptional regulator [Spirochaetia bacterium]